MRTALPAWPYPAWIAHRGAGTLAPENTLAALRLGQAHGFRMAECDVRLSADHQPFLMHDATLGRTTNGRGAAAARPWSALARLDAGSWHGAAHAGEPLCRLEALAAHALATGLLLNLELKASARLAHRTGSVVGKAAAALWRDAAVPPLLSAFDRRALQGAREAAPQLPRALLLERLHGGWLDAALALGCVAVVGEQTALDAAAIAAAHAAGLRVLAYTVNDASAAARLRAAGIDGLITDAVDRFDPG